MESKAAILVVGGAITLNPFTATRFQKMECAHNICVYEVAGPLNGTVHVRLRRKMQNMSYRVLSHDFPNARLVSQIGEFKEVLRMPGYAL